MISVIIPTYNSRAYLEKCLEALNQQRLPRDAFEVIVVDDGSTDDTKSLQEQFPIRYVFQRNQGPAAARNTGLRNANGDVVLYIDADCIATPHLLSTVQDAFREPDIMGLKGFYRTKQQELIARFAQLEYEYKYLKIARYRYIDFVDTYAAAYRRDLLLREGGFDARFPVASGEDIDLSYRLSSRGYKMIACQDMIVFHHHPDTLKKYLKRKYKVGFWRALLYKNHAEKIFSDSHTPFSVKFQVCALMAIVVCLVLSLFYSLLLWGAVALAALYFLSMLPFVSFCLLRDWRVGARTIPMVFLRDVMLAAGLAAGVVSTIMHREFSWARTVSQEALPK